MGVKWGVGVGVVVRGVGEGGVAHTLPSLPYPSHLHYHHQHHHLHTPSQKIFQQKDGHEDSSSFTVASLNVTRLPSSKTTVGLLVLSFPLEIVLK